MMFSRITFEFAQEEWIKEIAVRLRRGTWGKTLVKGVRSGGFFRWNFAPHTLHVPIGI